MPKHWYHQPMIAFDLETTGADPTQAIPVSFALADFDLGDVTHTRYGLVNPGVPIPPETTEIHGITDEMVVKRGGDLTKSIEGLAARILKAGVDKVPLVGCNLRYDLTVVDCQLRAICEKGLRDFGWDGPVVDCLVLDRGTDKYRRGGRKLTDLAEHYGVRLPHDLHAAHADAVLAGRVCVAIAEQSKVIGSLTLPTLMKRQIAWHFTWASDYSKYRLSKGDSALPAHEMIWPLPPPEILEAES